jgi:hypothetical protein
VIDMSTYTDGDTETEMVVSLTAVARIGCCG